MYRRKEIIGDCTLYLGDSLEIMPDLGVFDHIICDPPYEAIIHENNKKLSAGGQLKDKRNPFKEWDFDCVDDIRAPFCELAKEKSRGWFIAFCIAEGVAKWEFQINESKMKYKRTCLWIKPDGMPQFNGQCPGIGYECFVTAWSGSGHSKWNGGGKHGIYTFPKDSSSKTSIKDKSGKIITHPTEKPIKLMCEIIKDFTNHSEAILDPFMGSGTTGVACVKLGRKFTGIELDEKYFDIACKRIEEAYKQPDLFIEQPKKNNPGNFNLMLWINCKNNRK